MKKVKYSTYALLLVLSFFIVGCPPYVVRIISPSNGDSFGIGDEINFTGSAIDFQDGELSGDSLVWASSIDDEIGTGTEFTRDDLTEGIHEITLTATNSKEEERTATITITIGEGTVTTTTTTSNISHKFLGSTITCTMESTGMYINGVPINSHEITWEATHPEGDELTYAWELVSDEGGIIWSGEDSPTVDIWQAGEGYYELILTVTDTSEVSDIGYVIWDRGECEEVPPGTI